MVTDFGVTGSALTKSCFAFVYSQTSWLTEAILALLITMGIHASVMSCIFFRLSGSAFLTSADLLCYSTSTEILLHSRRNER